MALVILLGALWVERTRRGAAWARLERELAHVRAALAESQSNNQAMQAGLLRLESQRTAQAAPANPSAQAAEGALSASLGIPSDVAELEWSVGLNTSGLEAYRSFFLTKRELLTRLTILERLQMRIAQERIDLGASGALRGSP